MCSHINCNGYGGCHDGEQDNVLQATSTANIFCDSFWSCRSAFQIEGDNVFCRGYFSCDYTQLIHANSSVTCGAQNSCQNSGTIKASLESIQCLSTLSCSKVII